MGVREKEGSVEGGIGNRKVGKKGARKREMRKVSKKGVITRGVKMRKDERIRVMRRGRKKEKEMCRMRDKKRRVIKKRIRK